jgi:hypothetical protein
MALTEEETKRLAQKREAKANRELDEQADRERKELAFLELEERFAGELGGKLGEAFEIVDCGTAGLVVLAVRPGQGVVHKAFTMALEKDKVLTPENCQRFTMSCVVHPKPEELAALVGERIGVYTVCAGKLHALFEGGRNREQGK